MARVVWEVTTSKERAREMVTQLAKEKRHPLCFERVVSAENVQARVHVVVAEPLSPAEVDALTKRGVAPLRKRAPEKTRDEQETDEELDAEKEVVRVCGRMRPTEALEYLAGVQQQVASVFVARRRAK